MSWTKEKKIKAMRAIVKIALERKRREKEKARRIKYTESRYDEVYFRGLEWLDNL